MPGPRAATVSAYLKSLPVDRRKTIAAVREVIRSHLPAGYAEAMNWGMICYEVPLKIYPDTYNGQPLMFAGLASQKNYCALYLMCACQSDGTHAKLTQAFAKAGKKPDMGKSCIRFRSTDDLPLAAIGKIVAAVPVRKFIATYEQARTRRPGKC